MTSPDPAKKTAAAGVLYAVLAYGSWGVIPILWKQMVAMPPLVVVADRVLTSFAFVAVVLTLQRRWAELAAAGRDRQTRRVLTLSALMITSNWLIFLWAVMHGKVMQASLGYFINPLVNVFVARLFLGEALRPAQWLGVLLAGAGVLVLVTVVGEVPWIALLLAGTFAAYGLLRRRAPVEALTGLALETALTLPLALGWVIWEAARGVAVWGTLPREHVAVALAGAATALPLWWFALGARRLRFSTLGVLQFISPTGQFLLAVFLYDEPFGRARGLAFALIWAAIIVYSVDAVRSLRQATSVVPRTSTSS